MNIDKVREERQLLGVDRWFNHQCKGILFWATGVGKTYGATLAIRRIEKQKQPMYLVAVPSFELKKQWEERLSKVFPKKVTDRIIVETIQTLLFRNIKYIVDVYIVDEIHEFTSEERIKLLNGTLVEYKAILGLTASADDKNFKTISNLLPIVDVISDEEAREKGFIAEFIEYNLALSLSGEELESYEHYSRIIAETLPKFQNDLTLAQFCISGGLDKKSGKYYAAPNWATAYAHKRGWKPNLDLRLEVNRQINDLWNPTKIVGYAKKLLNAIRDRKSLLQTCQSKYEATKKLVDKFDKVKTIIFSESTDFADNVAKLLETKHKVVVYHSNIKTVIKPSPKTGKPIKVGKTRLKREATESIRNGKARIIVTAKSLDKGFDVVDLRFGITASGTQNPTQYKQRGGRVKRKETEQIFSDCTVLLVNLYIINTQDEKWLKNRQMNAVHSIINVSSIDDISYTPPSNIEFSMDI